MSEHNPMVLTSDDPEVIRAMGLIQDAFAGSGISYAHGYTAMMSLAKMMEESMGFETRVLTLHKGEGN